MIRIRRLIWDEWNVEHISLHGIVPEDVEEVCHGDFLARQTYQRRLIVVGINKVGKLISVILAPWEEGTYYVVTARTASKKERRIYREIKGIDSNEEESES